MGESNLDEKDLIGRRSRLMSSYYYLKAFFIKSTPKRPKTLYCGQQYWILMITHLKIFHLTMELLMERGTALNAPHVLSLSAEKWAYDKQAYKWYIFLRVVLYLATVTVLLESDCWIYQTSTPISHIPGQILPFISNLRFLGFH